MQGFQIINNRINFLMFTQSIFFLAFATVITCDVDCSIKTNIATILGISGILFAWIFGYILKEYYHREWSRVDSLFEIIIRETKKDYHWFRQQGKIRIRALISIIIPNIIISIWVVLLISLFLESIYIVIIALILILINYLLYEKLAKK